MGTGRMGSEGYPSIAILMEITDLCDGYPDLERGQPLALKCALTPACSSLIKIGLLAAPWSWQIHIRP